MLTTYAGYKEENPTSELIFNQILQNSHLLIFFVLMIQMITSIGLVFFTAHCDIIRTLLDTREGRIDLSV